MSTFLMSCFSIQLLKQIQTEDKYLFYITMTIVSPAMITVKRDMTNHKLKQLHLRLNSKETNSLKLAGLACYIHHLPPFYLFFFFFSSYIPIQFFSFSLLGKGKKKKTQHSAIGANHRFSCSSSKTDLRAAWRTFLLFVSAARSLPHTGAGGRDE